VILSEILALRKMVINLLYGEKAGDPQPCRIGIFAEYNLSGLLIAGLRLCVGLILAAFVQICHVRGPRLETQKQEK